MIGNNSCGVRSIMAQSTARARAAPTTCTSSRCCSTTAAACAPARAPPAARRSTGSLLELRDRYADLIRERYPKIPRRVSGYNLDDLLPEKGFHVARALVGTESTCVTVLEATVHLVHSPPHRSLLVLGYPDAPAAGDAVPRSSSTSRSAWRGSTTQLVDDMTQLGLHQHDLSLLPDGHGWLLVEFGGETKEEADEQGAQADGPAEARQGRPARDEALRQPRAGGARLEGARGRPRRDRLPARQARHLGGLGGLGRAARAARRLPARPPQAVRRSTATRARSTATSARAASTRAGLRPLEHSRRHRASTAPSSTRRADLVVSYGGSLSGEHGDGQSRGELLPKMFGAELVEAFREFKAIWDPDWKMNPGKVVDPYPLDANLRLGPTTTRRRSTTHFAFPTTRARFAHATDALRRRRRVPPAPTAA